MAWSSHWKPSTWEQFRKGWEHSHLSSLLVFYWLLLFNLLSAVRESGRKKECFLARWSFFVLSSAAWPSQKISGPGCIIALTPQAVAMRLWSDSIENVILFKHNIEQCISIDIHLRKPAFWQSSRTLISTRYVPVQPCACLSAIQVKISIFTVCTLALKSLFFII